MKKLKILLPAAFLLLFAGAALLYYFSHSKLPLPFASQEVQSITLYHYNVPARAEKKEVTDPQEIQSIYHTLSSARVKESKPDDTMGSTALSFHFQMTDGSERKLLYLTDGKFQLDETGYQVWSNYDGIWEKYGGGAKPAQE